MILQPIGQIADLTTENRYVCAVTDRKRISYPNISHMYISRKVYKDYECIFVTLSCENY